MPKKRSKKATRNAYFFYMLHFEKEEAKRKRYYPDIAEISRAASASWNNMNDQQREPFKKKAKEAKLNPHREDEKYTSQGIPLSLIEKEQKENDDAKLEMLKKMRDIVQNAFIDNAIGSQEFFFISGKYFVNANGTYLPAELAMVKFTFERGIGKKFHTFINPDQVPEGFRNDAKENSNKSHQLPIPPHAKGERNYRIILDSIDDFMGNGREIPPVFTTPNEIPIIESFMQQFCDHRGGSTGRYRVYPLRKLFFDIKEKAVKDSLKGFRAISIAEEHLKNDYYAYYNTACNYHLEKDAVQHCALADVQRWAFIFAGHICDDLNIERIAGQHYPT